MKQVWVFRPACTPDLVLTNEDAIMQFFRAKYGRAIGIEECKRVLRKTRGYRFWNSPGRARSHIQDIADTMFWGHRRSGKSWQQALSLTVDALHETYQHLGIEVIESTAIGVHVILNKVPGRPDG